MGNTGSLYYGQVAVFQNSCYGDFLANGGKLQSFNQKVATETAQSAQPNANLEKPIILGTNSNAPFKAVQPVGNTVFEYYNLGSLQTDWQLFN